MGLADDVLRKGRYREADDRDEHDRARPLALS
jgi:hypothetical protein